MDQFDEKIPNCTQDQMNGLAIDTRNKVSLADLIVGNNLYLVHVMPKMPDLLIDEGKHGFSSAYYQENNVSITKRLSVHFYTNDFVYTTRGSWETYEYVLIVNMNEIRDYIMSNELADTVGTYGINYGGLESTHIAIPKSDTGIYERLQKWLPSDRIIQYTPCDNESQYTKKRGLNSLDKDVCKTGRDITDEIITKIFRTLHKNIPKIASCTVEIGQRTGFEDCLKLYNPDDNAIICKTFVNNKGVNVVPGDGNIFEENQDHESMISLLDRNTNNRLLTYGLTDDMRTNLKMEDLSINYVLTVFNWANTKNSMGTKKLIETNTFLKNLFYNIKNDIYDSLTDTKKRNLSFELFNNIFDIIAQNELIHFILYPDQHFMNTDTLTDLDGPIPTRFINHITEHWTNIFVNKNSILENIQQYIIKYNDNMKWINNFDVPDYDIEELQKFKHIFDYVLVLIDNKDQQLMGGNYKMKYVVNKNKYVELYK